MTTPGVEDWPSSGNAMGDINGRPTNLGRECNPAKEIEIFHFTASLTTQITWHREHEMIPFLTVSPIINQPNTNLAQN